MKAYIAWRLHKAVKLHLTTLSYDIFQYRGAVRNASEETFERNSRDKGIFKAIGEYFSNGQDAVQYFVANLAYSTSDDIYDHQKATDNYRKWILHKESMTRFVLEDLEKIGCVSDALATDGMNPPRLLKMVAAGEILPQTAVAMNRHLHFVDGWITQDYFGLSPWSIKIKKLDKFVKCNDTLIETSMECNSLDEHEKV